MCAAEDLLQPHTELSNIVPSNLDKPAMIPTPVSKSPLERFADDPHHKPILLGVLLVLSTLALYWRVSHYQFLVFDDKPYVTENIHVNTGVTLAGVVWSFTSFREGNWHPVTWLSHMADCQWFGLRPGPPHIVNVFLHAANALLLFFLLRRATGAYCEVFSWLRSSLCTR